VPDVPAPVEVVPACSLAAALADLRRRDVRALLCEGGPTLLGALLHERLVDELFLTLAPQLAGGGDGPTISSGPALAEPAALELVWALERAGSLYLRYAVRRG
jgi:riboflavin biosynthesis pyrimidine reductase